MSDKLYNLDVFAWSAKQAELLRRMARGERVNGLDWENLIEEIEDVGIAQRNAVASPLRQALVHLLKICGWPANEAVGHWKEEIVAVLADATSRSTPGMRQTWDLDRIYRQAVKQANRLQTLGAPTARWPADCPFSLEELLADDPDPNELAARLSATAPH